MQRWYDRLAALVAETRQRLLEIDPARLTRLSGGARDADGSLRLLFWAEPYRVRLPGLTVECADTGVAPTDFTQALLLAYLATADGTPPSGRWVSYRDLPDGMFYAQAFRGYAEVRLVRELGTGGLAAFRRGVERLGGTPIEIGSGAGNAAYAVQVLPRVRLASVYWPGDEDFASQASILFEDTAPHYLSTDGLAVLGSHLVNKVLKEAREVGAA
jgi:hypothetical protein